MFFHPSEPTFRREFHRGAKALVAALSLTAAGCTGHYRNATTLPPPASSMGADDFVEEVRQISRKEGLLEARKYLVGAVAERDDSHGEMERRLIRTSADKDFVYSDSLVAMPESRKKAIGIAMIPGMKAKGGLKPSKPVQALAAAAREAETLGFQAEMIPAISRGSIKRNAKVMSEALAEVFNSSDQVILLAKSKGAHDLLHYLRYHGSQLPAEQRAKLRAVCILAGTVQGSYVADWFANHTNPWASGTRTMLFLTGRGRQIDMLRNVGTSPWKDVPDGFPRSLYPNLTFVNLVVLPDGEDGRSTGDVWNPFMVEQVQISAGWESPNDSLVETAAEVVPDHIDVPQWIVRTSGSHAFPKGKFLNGDKVTPATGPLEDGTMDPEAGAEIMNAFLRALPKSLME